MSANAALPLVAPARSTARIKRSRISYESIGIAVAGLAYALIVYFAIRHHEPWADEAQAWLIARDASLTEIWTKLTSLEGTPALWHSLLHGLIRLGLPYTGLNFVSGLLGLLAAVLFLRFSPFPFWVRILVPFTYFFCFQYAVIARSYALAPVLAFGAVAVYCSRKHLFMSMLLLLLLAGVSAQAYILSIALALTFVTASLRDRTLNGYRTELVSAAIVYALCVALIGWAALPRGSGTFVITPNESLANLVGISRYAFNQAFGDGYWPVIILGLSIPAMWGSVGLPFFALSSISLCAFGSLIFSNLWHHGFLVLAWVIALWLSQPRGRTRWLMYAALALFVCLQCSWTWRAMRYDWKNQYSGSRAMAAYMKKAGLAGSNMFAVGFPTSAVQPYFRSNLFTNFATAETHQAFWLWSKQNHTNDSIEELGKFHPHFLLLGFSSDADERLWHGLAVASGYTPIVPTQGHLFWRTQPVQPESFELLEAGPHTSNVTIASALDLRGSDPQNQLLWGFSEPIAEGRWANSNCGLMLHRPPLHVAESAFEIKLDLLVPPETLRDIGPLKLSAYACGHRFHPFLLDHSGEYHLTDTVAARDLFWSMVPIALQFEKAGLALMPLQHDKLAAVRRIEITPR